MRRAFGDWKFRHLLLSWSAYWIGLAAWTLAPAATAIWRVSRPDVKGDVSVGIADGILKLTVNAAGSAAWVGSVSLTTLALLLAVPPLAIWACWLYASSRARAEGARGESAQLASGEALPFGRPARQKDEARVS